MASSFEHHFRFAEPAIHLADGAADDRAASLGPDVDDVRLQGMVEAAWECLAREKRRRSWLPRRQRRDGYQWRRQGVKSRRGRRA